MGIGLFNKLGFFAIIAILAGVPLAFAQDGASKIPTDKGTLDVALTIKPFPPDLKKPVKISFEFLEPNTDNPKSHIDYRVTIVQGGQDMHTTYKQHSHSGVDSFTYAFMVEGSYDIAVSLEGIDFVAIPKEVASFPITIGDEVPMVIGVEEPAMIDLTDVTVSESTKIPQWIKQVAQFWIEDSIDDEGFVQVIEFLVKEGIITIPYAEAPEGEAATQIPSWIKSTAEFWVTGDISDDEFAIGLEWLINNGIIRISDDSGKMILVYSIEGNLYPIYQFHNTPQSPDCPGEHLHTTSGYTVNAQLVSFIDPTPGGCGLGQVVNLDSSEVSISDEQILAWEKATGIKIPQ